MIKWLHNKYFELVNKIPPEKVGYFDWIRIWLFVFPKYIVFPWIKYTFFTDKNTNNKPVKKFISYVPTTEGIGGQLCRYSAAIILADKFSLEYVHTDFASDFHRPSLNWQKFLGYSSTNQKYPQFIREHQPINIYYLPRFDLRYLKNLQLWFIKQIIANYRNQSDVLFLVSGYSFYPMNEYDNWQNIVKSMKTDYFRTSTSIKKLPQKNKKIQIVVLIRRGEIVDLYKNKDFQGKWRWVSIKWYKAVLTKIIVLCKGNYTITVFSDASSLSTMSSLLRLKHITVKLFKNSQYQPFEAFHAMVMADIVVCGLSSFPYFAASLSDGIKIVPPSKIRLNYFPKEDEKGWIYPNNNAYFDDQQIRDYLLRFRKEINQ